MTVVPRSNRMSGADWLNWITNNTLSCLMHSHVHHGQNSACESWSWILDQECFDWWPQTALKGS